MSMLNGNPTQPPLPSGWSWAQLDAIAEIKLGKMLSRKAFEPGLQQLPYLRNENVRWFHIETHDVKLMGFSPEEVRKFSLRSNDLLVCEGGEPGRCAIVTDQTSAFLFQKALHRVRPRGDSFDPRFIQYFFKRFIEAVTLIERRSETTIQHLPVEKMQRISVPLPPRAEQSRIADRIEELLSDLSAGVSALERVKKKLRRYRSAVLHAAVTGRLTADWRQQHGPPTETGEQLLARILVERRKQWEERTLAKYARSGKAPPKGWQQRYPEPLTPAPNSPLNLPEGWCCATHDQIGDVQLGRQRSPEHHYGEHMRPYLRVANVYESEIDTSNILQMNFTPGEFETYALRKGDILLNEGQSMELVGRPAMYHDEVPGACFQNTLVRQRVFSGVNEDFALNVCLAQFRSGRYRKIASITTSIAHLGAQRFAGVEFPLPPVEEQQAIVDAVNEKLSQIDAMETEVTRGLARAARLKQSILKYAFEGKLVAQDPNDEPASALLARIQSERAVNENGRAKRKTFATVAPDLVEEDLFSDSTAKPAKAKRGRSKKGVA